MVQIPDYLKITACLMLLAFGTLHAEQNSAAQLLWKSFQDQYQTYSYQPLNPESLDAKAREALIKASGPRFRTWKVDDHPTFPQMVSAMTEKDPSISEFDRVELALHALMPEIDAYGNYQFAADIAQLNEAVKQGTGSVHMTLDNSRDGETLCFPQEGGPAQLAGVAVGAKLLEVDGRPVKDKSLNALKLSFVGPPDTEIQLKVRQPHGKEETLRIRRTSERFPNVSVNSSPLGVTLRIRGFAKNTATEVKEQMAAHGQPKRLTIDLRGNAGGLRNEALKVASLFFPEGTALAKFTTQSGVQTATDGNETFISPGAIRILQDRRTASAAEYLVAVLKESLPEITTVFGEPSYGKSHSTALITLYGGGKISVTEALLATGTGFSWDKSGIQPKETSAK